MTALLDRPSTALPAWTIGGPRLLAGLDGHELLDARAHLAVHGPLLSSSVRRSLFSSRCKVADYSNRRTTK